MNRLVKRSLNKEDTLVFREWLAEMEKKAQDERRLFGPRIPEGLANVHGTFGEAGSYHDVLYLINQKSDSNRGINKEDLKSISEFIEHENNSAQTDARISDSNQELTYASGRMKGFSNIKTKLNNLLKSRII